MRFVEFAGIIYTLIEKLLDFIVDIDDRYGSKYDVIREYIDKTYLLFKKWMYWSLYG